MYELLKMGFKEEDANAALQETGGDISLAISKLLA
jgi:NACalpha-BTF3-like transcription factor